MDRMSLIVLAVVALLISIAVPLVTRAGQRRVGTGQIVSKTYKAPSTYTQTPSGADRGFRTPTSIPIADAYVFEVRIDGTPELVRGAVNTVAGERLEPGQRVRVEYETRGLLFFGRRLVITSIERAD